MHTRDMSEANSTYKALEVEISQLRTRLVELEGENLQLQRRVARLEEQVRTPTAKLNDLFRTFKRQAVVLSERLPRPNPRRLALSCFIILNFFTVLFMNRPVPVIQAGEKVLTSLDAGSAYFFRYSSWLLRRYAHLTGLDNRWQMFGRQSRFNWWYAIKARYGDHDFRVLPLPHQSKRTFLEAEFFDFKETKFHLNLYPRPHAREAYASYLCRQYPAHRGRSISSIVYELHWQMLLPREEASRTGEHLNPDIYQQVVNEYQCRAPQDVEEI